MNPQGGRRPAALGPAAHVTSGFCSDSGAFCFHIRSRLRGFGVRFMSHLEEYDQLEGGRESMIQLQTVRRGREQNPPPRPLLQSGVQPRQPAAPAVPSRSLPPPPIHPDQRCFHLLSIRPPPPGLRMLSVREREEEFHPLSGKGAGLGPREGELSPRARASLSWACSCAPGEAGVLPPTPTLPILHVKGETSQQRAQQGGHPMPPPSGLVIPLASLPGAGIARAGPADINLGFALLNPEGGPWGGSGASSEPSSGRTGCADSGTR